MSLVLSAFISWRNLRGVHKKLVILLKGITLTVAEPTIAARLTALAVETFVHSFGKYNTKEDMDKYLADEMSVEKLASELLDENSTFFLAWHIEELVGFAKVRTGPHPDAPENCRSAEVERIYVSQYHQSRQIGAILMERCIEFAKSIGRDAIWLGVWEHNYRAIAFYERIGFRLYGAHHFLLGYDLQTDVLMMKKIDQHL